MTEIKFIDQSIRDGQQSLWGMRMRAGHSVPVMRTSKCLKALAESQKHQNQTKSKPSNGKREIEEEEPTPTVRNRQPTSGPEQGAHAGTIHTGELLPEVYRAGSMLDEEEIGLLRGIALQNRNKPVIWYKLRPPAKHIIHLANMTWVVKHGVAADAGLVKVVTSMAQKFGVCVKCHRG